VAEVGLVLSGTLGLRTTVVVGGVAASELWSVSGPPSSTGDSAPSNSTATGWPCR
jgi:hypothetical protein